MYRPKEIVIPVNTFYDLFSLLLTAALRVHSTQYMECISSKKKKPTIMKGN